MNQTLALVDPLATPRSRRPTLTALTLVALVVSSSAGFAQTVKGKVADAKAATKADAKAATKADAKAATKADAKAATKAARKTADAKSAADKATEVPPAPPIENSLEPAEVFRDPLIDDALKNTFRPMSVRALPLDLIRRVRAMAAGEASIDPAVIKQYVDFMVSELTSRTNIAALLDPPSAKLPATSLARLAIQNAGDNLLQPIFAARAAKNSAFLSVYTPILNQTLPKILDNHFYARIEAMMALATAASADALPVFTKQLADPKQTVWVKLWAARGVTAVFESTTVDIQRALAAAKALAGFLSQDNVPWPAQMRALEALGSTRQPSGSPSQGKVELIEVAVRHLADPKSNLQLRSYAAWALGMMPPGPRVAPKFNYAMITYRIGALAAEVAEAASASMKANPERAKVMAGLLLYQIYPAFAGEPGLRDSGLAVTSAGSKDAAFVKQVKDSVQALAAGSVELTRSAGGMITRGRKDMADQIKSLKALLAKGRPADWHVIPGGADFPLADAKAAGDDDAKP